MIDVGETWSRDGNRRSLSHGMHETTLGHCSGIRNIVAERFNAGPDDPDDPPPSMIALAARWAMLKN